MSKVYVLTNETAHCLIGVFSTHKVASAVMMNVCSGWSISDVKLGPVCDDYTFISPDESELVEYCIEMAELDDPMFLP